MHLCFNSCHRPSCCVRFCFSGVLLETGVDLRRARSTLLLRQVFAHNGGFNIVLLACVGLPQFGDQMNLLDWPLLWSNHLASGKVKTLTRASKAKFLDKHGHLFNFLRALLPLYPRLFYFYYPGMGGMHTGATF